MAKKKVQKKTISKHRARKTVSKKKTTPRANAPKANTLDAVSTQDLRAQLHARERAIRTLERRRERLLDEIAKVEAELMQHGGVVSGVGGRRSRNENNLGDALAEALRGKEMRVSEAVQAVIDHGYKTTASNFRTIVNQKLISDKRFKKVERGVYTA